MMYISDNDVYKVYLSVVYVAPCSIALNIQIISGIPYLIRAAMETQNPKMSCLVVIVIYTVSDIPNSINMSSRPPFIVFKHS